VQLTQDPFKFHLGKLGVAPICNSLLSVIAQKKRGQGGSARKRFIKIIYVLTCKQWRRQNDQKVRKFVEATEQDAVLDR